MASMEPLVVELKPAPDAWRVARSFAGLPHLLFLDSANHPQTNRFNRYSYVTADPIRWISARTDDRSPPPLEELAQIMRDVKIQCVAGLPPFQGGISGMFGYELAHLFEKLPHARIESDGPDLAVGIYDWVISWDHVENRAWIVSSGLGDGTRAGNRLAQVKSWLATTPLRTERPDAVCYMPEPSHYSFEVCPIVGSNFTPAEFRAATSRIIEYIHAGDCYQVNLSQQLSCPNTIDVCNIYEQLRSTNPAPFAGFLAINSKQTLLSASPEQFLRVDHTGCVTTRPIKGTRPRSHDPARDAANLAVLQLSEKDRAENVMIVDLLRNDLGKVCEYGSIKVERVCEPESHPTVHHLVSEVTGQLRKGKTALDLLIAAFPGGSVTGAPKIRAMEIITELEPDARGAYCGSLGYIGFNGTMDMNILIRTMTADSITVRFNVGAGIVADSDPEKEYFETLVKAEGMLQALGVSLSDLWSEP
jgi:para-aminobenzoate synthetase component 1